MARKLEGRIVIATHNPGKLREMQALLAPFGLETVSAGDLGLPEPDETGATFIDNALIKARAAAQAAQLPAFADDTGLCVEALDGAPGLYTARWAGPAKDYDAAMARIEAGLRERDCFAPAQRRAHFICALAVAWPDGEEETFVGRVEGACIWPPRGPAGFGYDPMFQPDGFARTFGEMTPQEKHGLPADGSRALSHRARAFQALMRACL